MVAEEKEMSVNEDNPSAKYGSRSGTKCGSFKEHHRCWTLRIRGTSVPSQNGNNTHQLRCTLAVVQVLRSGVLVRDSVIKFGITLKYLYILIQVGKGICTKFVLRNKRVLTK
jgi:hypothetical protein